MGGKYKPPGTGNGRKNATRKIPRKNGTGALRRSFLIDFHDGGFHLKLGFKLKILSDNFLANMAFRGYNRYKDRGKMGFVTAV